MATAVLRMKRLKVEVQFAQRIAAGVVDQQDQRDAALGEDLPHEVKALLTRRAIEVDGAAVGELHRAIVEGDGGLGLDVAYVVGGGGVGADRRDVAGRSDGGGFAGADRTAEDDLVVAHRG
jgi:hypothetical protein